MNNAFFFTGDWKYYSCFWCTFFFFCLLKSCELETKFNCPSLSAFRNFVSCSWLQYKKFFISSHSFGCHIDFCRARSLFSTATSYLWEGSIWEYEVSEGLLCVKFHDWLLIAFSLGKWLPVWKCWALRSRTKKWSTTGETGQRSFYKWVFFMLHVTTYLVVVLIGCSLRDLLVLICEVSRYVGNLSKVLIYDDLSDWNYQFWTINHSLILFWYWTWP